SASAGLAALAGTKEEEEKQERLDSTAKDLGPATPVVEEGKGNREPGDDDQDSEGPHADKKVEKQHSTRQGLAALAAMFSDDEESLASANSEPSVPKLAFSDLVKENSVANGDELEEDVIFQQWPDSGRRNGQREAVARRTNQATR
ncbi:unnamed protein product, partial [Heterosigma akashiwo]